MQVTKRLPMVRRYPVVARIGWGMLAGLMLFVVIFESYGARRRDVSYALSSRAQQLVGEPKPLLANSLKFSAKTATYEYNQGYKPGGDVSGVVSGPKFSASFSIDPEKGVSIIDPVSQTSVKFKPRFNVAAPRQDQNRLFYPLVDRDAVKVYTLKAVGMKEDIILNRYQGDEQSFEYDLELAQGTEARMEQNGSLAIYGVSPTLLGNISTSTDDDAELLKKARENGKKNNLLFTFPKPFIKEFDKKISKAKAWFELKGDNRLILHASGLKNANYPLSVDPSIYIETAAKLMLGNNETNIDFDTDNELIQKSQTTGARIDAWSSTNNLNTSVWQQGTAVAGGYIYSAGGALGSTITTQTYYNDGADSFVVPTGISTITVKVWGAGGGGAAGSGSSGIGGDGGGGGYTKADLTVTPGETLNLVIGTGGSRAIANRYGGDGGGFSAVLRSSTYLLIAGGGAGGGAGNGTGSGGDGGAGGGANGQNGTAGTGGAGGGATTATFGTAGSAGTGGTAGSVGAAYAGGNAGGSGAACNTAVTNTQGGAGGTGGGGDGGDVGSCANGGGAGGGRYGGGGGGSANTSSNRRGGGGGGGSGLATGANIVQNVGNYITPANSSDAQRNGAGQGGTGTTSSATTTSGADGAIVISYVESSGTSITDSVLWAKFNTTTNAIESPNPGAGACTGWCTNTAYNLPASLKGLSLLAYNGYLYAIGGSNSGNTPQTSVYIAKLGANGEPQLWHPTGGTPTYWYTDTSLTNARSFFGAVAYNNRLYIFGGLTTSTTLLSTNTTQYATMRPNGTLTGWTSTGMSALSSARYGLSAQVYNDIVYVLGGNTTFNGSPSNTVEYARLNADGTMNAWQTTNTFTTGRQTMGGIYSALWGAYIYIGGGCTVVDSSGRCTTIASDVQLASVNADGSLAPWNTILGLSNDQIGYTFIAWQNGLYKLGGCGQQSLSTGECLDTSYTVEYGVINQDGDASTVSNSSAWSSTPVGGNTCSGYAEGNSNLRNCNLPDPGDNAGQGGQMSSMVVINNGYIYNIGGCTDISNGNECSAGAGMSGNTSYAALNSNGEMVAPASCSGTWDGLWCVDSTNRINGTTGIGTAAATVFNNRIYVIGGTNGNGTWYSNIYHTAIGSDGSIGAWATIAPGTGVGQSGLPSVFPNITSGEVGIGYGYAFTRANPDSAGSSPGNLFYIGGCNSTGSGVGCSEYTTGVYKCNISTTGGISGCATTGQMQIDADNINTGSQGLGLMAGTVYANRVYLVGGVCDQIAAPVNEDDPCSPTYYANRKDTIYARVDNTNNIVDNTTGLSSGSWAFTTGLMDPVRRRAVSFGYNGYVYSLAGYSGTASLQDLLFAKIDVSTGDMSSFSSSGVVVTPRWDLRAIVSNGYVYAIGGCGTGDAPAGCTAMQPQIQTFQLYNNDSGAPVGFTASANTYTTDRTGAGVVIHNGYMYVAGGCTALSPGDCTAVTDNVQFARIDEYGNIGTWANTTDSTLPAGRAFGKLVTAGNTLYYIGGNTVTDTDERPEIYYGVPSTSTGNVTTWLQVNTLFDLPDGLTDFAAAAWNNRIYVLGGVAAASGATVTTVYASPDLSTGGDITSAWTTTGMTAFNVARSGATAIAYANNLYILGGYTGTYYLNDVQFAKIDTDGTVGSWSYGTSLPEPIRQADGFAVNGYMYLIGGRSADTTCASNTLVAPVSANTTIASGNNPTGVGDWYETNQKYGGGRYGAAAAYYQGKAYVVGGGCPGGATEGITYTTAGSHSYTVPAGTTSITAKAWGGGGGGGGSGRGGAGNSNYGGDGGGAGSVTSAVSVSPGDSLTIYVGGGGGAGGGSLSTGSSGSGGGGGGYSGIYNNTTGSWLVVAAGGAGGAGGGHGATNYGGRGGVGGGTSGGDGTESADTYGDPGLGGTSTSGTAGTSANDGGAGSSLSGGAGADGRTSEGVDGSGAAGGTNGGGAGGLSDQVGRCAGAGGGGAGYANATWGGGGGGGSCTAAGYTGGGGGGGGASYFTGSGETLSGTLTAPGDNGDPDWAGGAGTGGAGGPARQTSGTGNAGTAGTAGRVVIAASPAVIQQTTVLSQPQVAKYSRMIDTDTDVFPNSWLLNGLDNSIGARWTAKYSTMHDISDGASQQNPNEDCGTGPTMPVMTTWGQETNFGNVTLGTVNPYAPLNSSGGNINCARYYYFSISIDASQTFGYPEDVNRGPTIWDLSLFFTADPSKRMIHGKTFTGGLQQPLDTPCRQSNNGGGATYSACPLL